MFVHPQYPLSAPPSSTEMLPLHKKKTLTLSLLLLCVTH